MVIVVCQYWGIWLGITYYLFSQELIFAIFAIIKKKGDHINLAEMKLG